MNIRINDEKLEEIRYIIKCYINILEEEIENGNESNYDLLNRARDCEMILVESML